MATYPLKTLLELRRREEGVAEENWRVALARLSEAQAALAARDEAVEAARRRVQDARGGPSSAAPDTSSSAMALSLARFVGRRRDELARAEADRASFRSGPLASARAEEGRARVAYGDAHRALEAVERHQGRHAAEVRQQVEKREEAARDEAAQANRHRRTRDERS